MPDLPYRPVPHDPEKVLEEARQRPGFSEAYEELGEEFALLRELLAARQRAKMTQDEVAESMETTKSAVSRLETAGKHSPSLRTLRKYAHAVGCKVEVRLIPMAETRYKC